ncbi:alpha/beta fold hydrolase [Kutzneria kofuensis]|uniref:Pimeloyl-ACP methyl ester carboxylesterase n=1 Tax=Kutzneria kofuensis TaxID=103725 RepID=A0A7W9NJE2_9PSEU|nr:alpha/beta fold hydrolase [Kutzneria kofuensis]MBB5894860.1 pimeloyl-ACP methyl ester carboxylesterase [Kutzneria kofuensis]
MPHAPVRISGGDAVVEYDVTGAGPGVVLVHGTAATRLQWQGLTSALQDRFTVVAPDYSGSGGTVDHGGPLLLSDLADEIVAAADHAGLDSFHLVGHSLGAAIATHVAGTHPDRVLSLALHAGWVRTTPRMAAEFLYWKELLAADVSLFARMLPLMAFGPRYWSSSPDNEALVRDLAAAITPGALRQIDVDTAVDLTPVLDSVVAPTLVLASIHDRVIDPAQQQALLAGIATSRYAEIDAGHGAPAEDPTGFITRVTGFLDELTVAV